MRLAVESGRPPTRGKRTELFFVARAEGKHARGELRHLTVVADALVQIAFSFMPTHRYRMAQQHPAENRQEWESGTVVAVHPDTWEVDVRLSSTSSAVLRRVRVHSHFLPEVHTKDRQSRVIVGWLDARSQSPVALPLHHAITPRGDKSNHVFWSEHLRYRIRITRDGVFEIRNLTGDVLCQIQIIEQDGVIRLDTPNTHIVMNDAKGSIDAECTETLTAKCKNAKVEAEENVDVQAGGDISAQAEGNVKATAAGNVEATALGDVTALGQNVTVTGLTNVTVLAAGAVSVTAANVSIMGGSVLIGGGNVTIDG